MIKAIFTDFDGVIRHWENQLISRVELKNGLTQGYLFQAAFADELLMPTIRGLQTHADWVQKIETVLCNKVGREVSRELIEAWSQTSYTVDRELVDNFKTIFPDSKLVLVTNATDRLSSDLNSSGLIDKFDAIVNSSDIGYAKPDKGFYERGLDLVRLRPEDVVFIDDSLQNIQAAVTFGLASIHFLDRQLAMLELKRLREINDETGC